MTGDLKDDSSVRELVGNVRKSLNDETIGCLFNCAGDTISFDATGDEAYDTLSLTEGKGKDPAGLLMQVKHLAPRRLVQAFMPEMKENGGGAICYVASSQGFRTSDNHVDYASANVAHLAFMRDTARTKRKCGIHCFSMVPGFVNNDRQSDETAEKMKQLIATDQVQDAYEFGATTVGFLAGHMDDVIGAEIWCDSGRELSPFKVDQFPTG